MEKITLDTITSKNNQIIKDTKRLLTSSKLRRQQNAFVLEGARLCFDVLNSVYKVKTLLFTEAIFNKYPEKVKQLSASSGASYLITDDVAATDCRDTDFILVSLLALLASVILVSISILQCIVHGIRKCKCRTAWCI